MENPYPWEVKDSVDVPNKIHKMDFINIKLSL